ncbi:polyprenyl synthetase family protein [Streptomyces sp. RB17]|uniref:polyprenyl synthetase family protein n=1 Tax=Streptomyces sp. RB17 TaxID=2585197 RepID=UPI001296960F|nr:class 1 isoprenoid biosynthesis enzyme [Streptomyces sp. RB17]
MSGVDVEAVVREDAALLEADLDRFLAGLAPAPSGAAESVYAAALTRALYAPVADAVGSKVGQEALRPAPGAPGGGRPLRPSMVYWAYRNYRGFGEPDTADEGLAAVRRAAVAVRVLLKAAVALDDVQDGSAVRYGEPALHSTHGVPLAVNTGSWLIAAALAHAADPDVVGSLLGSVAHGFQGQAVDIATRSPRTRAELAGAPHDERVAFWESTAALKTGTLFRMPLDAALAALRVVAEERDTLNEAMRQLGLASQLFNDLTDFVPEFAGARTHEDFDGLSNRVFLELLGSPPPDGLSEPGGEQLRSYVLGHPDLHRTLLALSAEAVERKQAAKDAVRSVCRSADSAAYFDLTVERKGHLVDRLHDTLRQRSAT